MLQKELIEGITLKEIAEASGRRASNIRRQVDGYGSLSPEVAWGLHKLGVDIYAFTKCQLDKVELPDEEVLRVLAITNDYNERAFNKRANTFQVFINRSEDTEFIPDTFALYRMLIDPTPSNADITAVALKGLYKILMKKVHEQ